MCAPPTYIIKHTISKAKTTLCFVNSIFNLEFKAKTYERKSPRRAYADKEEIIESKISLTSTFVNSCARARALFINILSRIINTNARRVRKNTRRER